MLERQGAGSISHTIRARQMNSRTDSSGLRVVVNPTPLLCSSSLTANFYQLVTAGGAGDSLSSPSSRRQPTPRPIIGICLGESCPASTKRTPEAVKGQGGNSYLQQDIFLSGILQTLLMTFQAIPTYSSFQTIQGENRGLLRLQWK